MIIYGRHPDLKDQERSYLASTVAASDTTLYVKSSSGFSEGQLIIIGDVGQEKTELKRILSVNHTTNVITLKTTDGWTGFLHSHSTESTVTVTPYDQVDFYQSATEGGTYTYIATVNIDVDDEFTQYDYTAGTTTDYYKVRFKNSITSNVSEFSGEVAAEGYPAQSVGAMIDDIRVMIGDTPDDNDLLRLINIAQDAVYAVKDKWYFSKKKETYTTVDSTSSYELPTDFRDFEALYEYDVTNAAWTKLKYIDYDTFMQNYISNTTEADGASYYTIDETTDDIIINPTPEDGGNTLEFLYFSSPPLLSEYTDETPVPNPRVIVFWVISKIEAARKNNEQSKLYWNEYQAALNVVSNKRIGPLKSFYVKG